MPAREAQCVRQRAGVQQDQPDIVSLVFVYICRTQLGMCVNYIELGIVARGCYMNILTAHEGDSNGLVTSVDWKNGTWVDGYLCQRFHIHVAQLGYCDYHAFLLHVYNLCYYQSSCCANT